MREGARAALGEPRKLQAAEHEQQADQVLLEHGLHVSKVPLCVRLGCGEGFKRTNSGSDKLLLLRLWSRSAPGGRNSCFYRGAGHAPPDASANQSAA